ncbi:MAG: hypothetical protein LAQ30_20900, partial [Acidobacteriia bacterium]|nr:hypothetical protein [Terriglobia bacterium]
AAGARVNCHDGASLIGEKGFRHDLHIGVNGQVQEHAGTRPLISRRLAAFALLGMINWLYQWFRPEGPTHQNELAEAYVDFFFRGLLGTS